MPPNSPSKGSQLRGMYIQNPRNFKVGPPPLRNPAYAPGYVSIRNKGAKKGGGLLILHQSDSIYEMKMEETIHQDMLTIRGQFKG